MKFNRIVAAIIGCLVLLSLPVSAETPILEELMRKYTFPLIFLSLAGAVAGVAVRRKREDFAVHPCGGSGPPREAPPLWVVYPAVQDV